MSVTTRPRAGSQAFRGRRRRAAGLLALAALLPAAIAGAFGKFRHAVHYHVGDGPAGIAAAKINRDRRTDLLVANCADDDVTVLLGKRRGKFGHRRDHPAGDCPEDVALGRFTKDRRKDIATLLNGDGAVAVLRGNGKGGFAGPVPYPTSLGNPNSMAVGRLNHDGRPDIAVTDDDETAVAVLLSKAAGGFKAPLTHPLGLGAEGGSVGIGDFDRDGRRDLAVSLAGDDSVAVLLGLGGGAFGSPDYFTTVNTTTRLEVADFNRDRKQDLAVTSLSGGTVSVLKGKGDGTFKSAVGYPAGGTGGPAALTAARLNGDRRLDLAIANLNSHRVEVLKGKPGGAFGSPHPYGVGDFPSAVAAGRFNRDRGTDLAVTDATDDDVSVLLNKR